ncbi:hypothetical protein M9Y10_012838 [Tritrichomonas musculus]|uniref:Uncharacterized protein n=1 Tax=Tritrichomonas musculus TaxID=1915356 RepID=A0ABR2IDJ8_9EUKA
MSSKALLTPSEQAQRLIDHARKILQELYKFSVELSEQNREKAQQKINYGKQVLNSLEQLPSKYLNSQDAGLDFLNIVYVNYISVKPNLENALNDLQKRIDENKYFEAPEIEDKNEEVKDKETIETDWKSPSDLNDNDYSSILKNLIHAAEKELENDENEDNEEETEEEAEADTDDNEEEEEESNENSENKKEDHEVDELNSKNEEK